MRFELSMIFNNRVMSIFLFLVFLNPIGGYAQGNTPVDSFYYYIRNVQDANEITPLLESDPDYKAPEAEITLVIYINELSRVKTMHIDLGNQLDLGDIRKWKFDMVEVEGKKNLKREEKLYAIDNSGKVIITEIVPATVYHKRMFLSVKTLDNLGVEVKKNSQKLN